MAFETLRRTFEHGAWTDRCFRAAAERRGLEGRDRALAQRLAYGAVQRRGTSDHLVGRLGRRPADELDPPIAAALRLGLYELLYDDAAAEHAAVGEAVELAKRAMSAGPEARRAAGAAGVVNAVLRRAARERERLLASLTDETPEAAAVAHSQPRWLAERWWHELGPDGARALMRALNEPAERSLRVNTLRGEPEALVAGLAERGEAVGRARAADPLLAPPEAIVATSAFGPALRERFAAGDLVAQARASQAVVAALDPRPGERILDLCAGPGIKSTHIAARLGDEGEVRAVEVHEGRAAEIADLAERLGAGSVRVAVADAAGADLGAGYDRVLVDPPCTDLGTLASRPDARWRKSADMPGRLAELQTEILRNGARALRPGGTLVYSTCTISRTENEDVVNGMLGADGSLEADDLGSEHPGLASTHDPRFLQTRPDRDGTAGFFIARLRRAGG